MVGLGERLVFEGAPIVEPPLQQDAATRKPEVHAGAQLDTSATCPSLSAAEAAVKAALRAAEDRRLHVESKKVRETYVVEKAQKLVGHRKGIASIGFATTPGPFASASSRPPTSPMPWPD
jgi:hypothetical protein